MNVLKVVHLSFTTRFGDIVNLCATFVIKFICLECLTQSRVFILQNFPMLTLQIKNTIWTNKYNIGRIVRVFILNPYPHGKIFLASSNNIFSCHKKKIQMAWKYFNNIQWCDMEYAPKILSCSLELAHPLTHSPLAICCSPTNIVGMHTSITWKVAFCGNFGKANNILAQMSLK